MLWSLPTRNNNIIWSERVSIHLVKSEHVSLQLRQTRKHDNSQKVFMKPCTRNNSECHVYGWAKDEYAPTNKDVTHSDFGRIQQKEALGSTSKLPTQRASSRYDNQLGASRISPTPNRSITLRHTY